MTFIVDVWMFACWQGMKAAITAVRLRARKLCALLGVQDVDAAVAKIDDGRGRSQVVLRAEPYGLHKEGSSGEDHDPALFVLVCSVARVDSDVHVSHSVVGGGPFGRGFDDGSAAESAGGEHWGAKPVVGAQAARVLW